MNSQAIMDLEFVSDEIYVEVSYNLDHAINKFIFSINSLLEIDSIESETKKLSWYKNKDYEPIFREKAQEIIVKSDIDFKTLKIKYHGKISGYFNIIEENRKALSFYSVWYPQETNTQMSDVLIRIHNLSDHFVLKADFDGDQKIWTYGDKGYDGGNIIALKKDNYYVSSEGIFDFYYLSDEEGEAGQYLKYYFKDVLDFYQNKLYRPKEIAKMDMVSLLMPQASGAYYRKELIVLSRILSEDCPSNTLRVNLAAIVAHEVAHNWCNGADCDTWDDWLNETTAEWSSLLYALYKDDTELFDHILDWKLKNYKKAPVIKTSDGIRPTIGVHDRGTILFYEIYKKYNKDILMEMLRTFVFLKEKSTNAYLIELKKNLGEEIAYVVERGLSLETYENML